MTKAGRAGAGASRPGEAESGGEPSPAVGAAALPGEGVFNWRAPAFPLAVGAALAPALAVLQSRAMAPLAVCCLLLSVVAARRADGCWPWPRRGAALGAALGLAGWGALSASWAIEPARALLAAGQLAGLALLAAAAARAVAGRPGSAALVGRGLLLGLPFGLLLGLADHWSGNAVRMAARGLERARPGLEFGLKPAASVMALLLPLALATPLPRPGRLLLLAGGLAALLLLPGDTPKLAAAAGAAAALLAFRWPGRARPAAALLAALLLVGGPALAGALAGPALGSRLPFSGVHRLVIWDFVLVRAAERPWLGWGMEGSRSLPGGRAPPDGAALDRVGAVRPGLREAFSGPGVESLPLHPHNGALQLLLELGWPGLLLTAGLAAALAMAAPAAAPGPALGVLVSGLASFLLSFGAWQPWWMATQALAAVLTAGLAGQWVRGREAGGRITTPRERR